MIRDVLIIKDGLPLISKSFSNSGNFISDSNDVLLMSGFLSALSSFSEEFKNLGTINEFKMSDSNLRLAFLKHPSISNLIFLASFDRGTNGVNVQRFLRKMSYTFLKRYNKERIESWDGNIHAFNSFAKIIRRYVNKISEENEVDFKEKVVELFDQIQDKIDNVAIQEEKARLKSQNGDSDEESHSSSFHTTVPTLKISSDINPDFYLTGSNSKNVLNTINGEKSIEKISKELNLPPEKVHSVCKNLVKLGFISLEEG